MKSGFRLARLGVVTWLVGGVLLCACSQGGNPANATATPLSQQNTKAAQAAQKLALYQGMLRDHREDLAAPIGQEIVADFPGTPAAAEVQRNLPQIEATAKAKTESDRLAALWNYQSAMQSGAWQYSASITSSKPQGDAAVQLILRRHAKWGQSVYLFGGGFVCKNLCDLPMRFDGRRETWKAYLPKTGEPALFIEDDQRFIAMLSKTKTVEMDVTGKDRGKEMLIFEVGGYDPAKFPTLPKKWRASQPR
ncbi:MAG: hypothetical protein ABIY40_00290 [Rhodanobacteraceae bacterium]